MDNEGKSVVPEQFLTSLRNRICKYMTAISKNVHINKFLGILKQCNYDIQKSIKMKPFDIKPDTYINFGIEFKLKNDIVW